MDAKVNVEDIFAKNVFTVGKMKEFLPGPVFDEVMQVRNRGGELSLKTADVVAAAMKDWAVSNGATHFTHWFQPLTGFTAEKHDSFINPIGNGEVIMQPRNASFPMDFTPLPMLALIRRMHLSNIPMRKASAFWNFREKN